MEDDNFALKKLRQERPCCSLLLQIYAIDDSNLGALGYSLFVDLDAAEGAKAGAVPSDGHGENCLAARIIKELVR